jgi:hypothetical protein
MKSHKRRVSAREVLDVHGRRQERGEHISRSSGSSAVSIMRTSTYGGGDTNVGAQASCSGGNTYEGAFLLFYFLRRPRET